MDGWSGFFTAQASASAALAGLIFVAISINLTKILAFNVLPNRGGQALILLLTIVVISSLMLLPGQTVRTAGIEALAVGVVVWVVITGIDFRSRRAAPDEFRRVIIGNMILNQLAALLYLAGGVAILVGGAGGLYWLVPAILFSYIKAMSDAWVLLIEINR